MTDWYLTESWLKRWCCMGYWEGAGSENYAGPPSMSFLPGLSIQLSLGNTRLLLWPVSMC